MILILTILVLYVTMVYGPIAALLVELFPTRIRYTAHVAAVSYRQRLVRRLPAADGLRHRGGDRQHLLRPVVPDRRSRLMTFVIGLFFMPETKDRDIYKDD